TWLSEDPKAVRFFDNLHWTYATAAAAMLSLLAVRYGNVEEIRWRKWFAIGLTTYALGQLVWDVQSAMGYAGFPAPSDLLYLWLGPCFIVGLWSGLSGLTTPAQRKIIALDMLTFSIAVIMLVLALYLPKRGNTDALSMLVMIAYPVTLLAATVVAILAVVSLRLHLVGGWLLFVTALLATGASWMIWNDMSLDGKSLEGIWLNSTFSVGILTLGCSTLRIRMMPSADPGWGWLFERSIRLLPLLAVVMAAFAVVLATLLEGVPEIIHDVANFGAVIVILLAVVRQSTSLQERDELLAAQAARYRAEESLRLSEERWKFALEGAGDGMWDWDFPSGKVFFSARWKEMLGYAEHELANEFATWEALLDPDFSAKTKAILQAHLNGETPLYQAEFRMRCKDGSWKWIMSRGMVIRRDADGNPLRVIGTHSDINTQKVSEEVIWKQANFDGLTGLPNRHMFRDRIKQEIMKSHRSRQRLALLFIDLDQFKEVNDSLGHSAGDQLLIEAAQRICSCVRDSDTVARLGGDEFTVILSQLQDTRHVEVLAESIIEKLKIPFRLGEELAYISASIGITLYPDDADDVDQLFKNADQAMYFAKSHGRRRYSYFTPSLHEAAQSRMRLISDLRGALAADQFILHFQPIVEMASGGINKAEALLRWQHPSLGIIGPDDFIPLAEETGLIHEIGDWVFHRAIECAERWNGRRPGGFQVSVNMSPVQFQGRSNTPKRWTEHLQQLGLAGHHVVVEITEGLLLNAESSVTDQLLTFSDAGVQVAIDDFGTGYSSLSYLKKFDIDYLKIDRSFVYNIDTDPDNLALSEAIVMMAHKLGLKVIAEGVETEAQHKLLAAMGCDFAQGYLYSLPVESAEFENLIS
ncbi:MAG: EAL domain-containing protein, partial [Gallionella sp.]